jgi:hypothetical protein
MAGYLEGLQSQQAREMEEKKQAYENQAQVGGWTKGLTSDRELTKELLEPARPGIRERVARDLKKLTRESRKMDRLSELQMLFDKHPDVARILDLIDVVRD